MEEEDFKQQKLEEMKKKLAEQQQARATEAEMESQIESLLRNVLTPEAKSRLSNVRLVNPELYTKAISTLAYAQQQGLKEKVSEEQLKNLLEKLNPKRETKITRK
ncbi:MAG: DNA-binding protein [Candidatus Diapherotrites archaeon]